MLEDDRVGLAMGAQRPHHQHPAPTFRLLCEPGVEDCLRAG